MMNIMLLDNVFLKKTFGDEELDALRDQFLKTQQELEGLYMKLAQWFGFDEKKHFCSVEGLPHELLPAKKAHHMTLFLVQEHRGNYWHLHGDQQHTFGIDQGEESLAVGQQYVQKVKQQVEELKSQGKDVTFADVARMLGIREEYIPKPRQPEISHPRRNLGDWLKRKPLPAPLAPEPPAYPATPEEILATLDKVLTSRKERMQIDQVLWQRYVEKVAGKTIDKATIGDFLIGLCKQKGLPLYDTSGKVIWPRN